MRQLFFYLSISALTLMSGCGEFTYKQGASVRDLDQAKQACKYANEANIEQCLEKNGWYVQKLDDVDLFATVSTSDNKTSQPLIIDVTKEEPNAIANTDAKATVDKKTVIEPVASKTSQTNPVDKPVVKKASAPVVGLKSQEKPASEKAVSEKAVSEKAVSEKTVDPNQTYKISSWWKMGAGEAKLRKDIAECTAQLGESHAPDMAKQTYTRAHVVCMHEHGWKGLRAYK